MQSLQDKILSSVERVRNGKIANGINHRATKHRGLVFEEGTDPEDHGNRAFARYTEKAGKKDLGIGGMRL